MIGTPFDQIVSGSKAKYAPSSPKIIAIVSTYARMAPSCSSDGAEPISGGRLVAVPWGTPDRLCKEKGRLAENRIGTRSFICLPEKLGSPFTEQREQSSCRPAP